jgi:hypothetical protein
MSVKLSRNKGAGAQHRGRFKKWQNLCPPQTRFLSSAVDVRLAPQLEAAGFHRVEVILQEVDWPVRGSEIELERVREQIIDTVGFNFAKYRTPRLQIHFSRREIAPPHAFIRSGNLVARKSQYYHYWGKPWWLPTRFWSQRASKRAIDRIEALIEQLLRFLDSGEMGPNISRRTRSQGTWEKSDNNRDVP